MNRIIFIIQYTIVQTMKSMLNGKYFKKLLKNRSCLFGIQVKCEKIQVFLHNLWIKAI